METIYRELGMKVLNTVGIEYRSSTEVLFRYLNTEPYSRAMHDDCFGRAVLIAPDLLRFLTAVSCAGNESDKQTEIEYVLLNLLSVLCLHGSVSLVVRWLLLCSFMNPLSSLYHFYGFYAEIPDGCVPLLSCKSLPWLEKHFTDKSLKDLLNCVFDVHRLRQRETR